MSFQTGVHKGKSAATSSWFTRGGDKEDKKHLGSEHPLACCEIWKRPLEDILGFHRKILPMLNRDDGNQS